jgi:hypothetical protein
MWTQLISHFEDLVNSWIWNVGLMYFFFFTLEIWQFNCVLFRAGPDSDCLKKEEEHINSGQYFRPVTCARWWNTVGYRCSTNNIHARERERILLTQSLYFSYALVLTVYVGVLLWLFFKVFFYFKIY